MTKYTNFTVIISSNDLVTFFSVFTVPFPTCQKHLICELAEDTSCSRSLETNFHAGILSSNYTNC